MFLKTFVTFLCLVSFLICCAGSAQAQIDTATIVGTVRDASESIVVGAEVMARRVATNETFTAVTNSNGDYRIFPLPVGEYQVTVKSRGFKTETKTGIILEVGKTSRVEFGLTVGDTNERIEVVSQAPLINTESPAVGQVIDNQKLIKLPLNSRDFATLAALTPSVNAPRGTVYGGGVAAGTATGIFVRGHRRGDNAFYLDGTYMADGNGATSIRPNIDALQEFEIKTGLYGAEYGVRPGGQVIAVTKSGTNELHGNVFLFHQNDNLNARNFFQKTKTEYKRNQFGATLGGPIYIPRLLDGKDKAWFFIAYQNETIRNFVPLTGIVPTADQKAGRFTTTIRDPLTGQPFANNTIPTNRISPVAQKLLDFWPSPNTTGSLNYTSPNSVANSENPQFIARIDFKTSDTNRWSGRFAYDSLPFLLTDAIQTFSHTRPRKSWFQSFSNTRTISGRYVNVASFHFFRRPFNAGVSNPHVEAAAGLNIPALLQPNLNPGAGLPRISVQGLLAIGDNGGPVTSAANLGNWQVKDDFSFQQGSHFLKLGVEYRKHYNLFNLATNASFTFTNRYTGNPFADFLLGFPMQTRSGGETQRGSFTQTSLYYYVQDDWKVNQRLTLNLGLRYELRLPWRDKRGFMSNFDPRTSTFNPPLQNLTLQPFETGRFTADEPLLEWRSKDGFLPRIGFAYRIGDRTVIRGGYGTFSNEPDVTVTQEFGSNPRPNALVRIFNASATTPNISISDPFPAALAASAIPRVTGVETPLKLTKTHSYGLSIQRELGGNWAAEIGYQGSHTANLMETVSFNDAVPGTGARQARRPNPAYQDIMFTMADADAWYDAMEIKVQKRAGTDGLFVLGSFTWSKGLDTASVNSAQLGIQRQRSINMPLHLNKATSDTHVPRRLVVTVGYELPFGPGKKFLSEGLAGRIIGGWSVQGILALQDGAWITAFLPGDALDTGSTFSQWPNLVRDANIDPGARTVARWFDTSAFVRPTGFVYGNAGRAPIEGPGLKNFDISIQREFRFKERHRLELRMDGFNFFNHPNFGLPGQNFGTGGFGVIGNALDPRFIQVGFRYNF